MDEEKKTTEQDNIEQVDGAGSQPVINELTPPPEAEQIVDDPEQEPEKSIVTTDSDPELETMNTTGITEEPAINIPDLNTDEEAPQVLATPPTEEEVETAEAASVAETPIPMEEANSEAVQQNDDAGTVGSENPSMPDDTITAQNETATIGMASSQMGKQQHPHRNNKTLAIIVTIVVAVLLVATVVYVYMNTDSNAKETSQSQLNQVASGTEEPQEEAPVDTSPARAEEVESLVVDIDQTISELDDEDFNETVLSDTQLGL